MDDCGRKCVIRRSCGAGRGNARPHDRSTLPSSGEKYLPGEKKKKKKKTAMEEMFTAKREGEKVAEWEDKWESIRTSQHSSE